MFSVIDIYQEWTGPVTPLVTGLRRLKNELGDDLLKFAVVSVRLEIVNDLHPT